MTRRYVNSCQTRLKVSLVIDCTAAEIRCLSSHKFVGNSGIYTLSFTNPQRNKSHGAISGDLGGQLCNIKSSGPLRQIQLRSSSVLRKRRTSASQWGGVGKRSWRDLLPSGEKA
ncbi:hypothetical protein AVEN_153688-1 [Araneus ventricosus]|uniref:Uncharacterized protein n=1 Tax=Araneus ventricosus TaxID=182803 RepID=A0A4Y2G459_ARAVE|nr:hypothetical protein AVEN_153688-1 [Araneus ventricosus]